VILARNTVRGPHSYTPIAALVLERDTIPKPDGLGSVPYDVDIEQNSIDFGRRSRKIGGRSTRDLGCIRFGFLVGNWRSLLGPWTPRKSLSKDARCGLANLIDLRSMLLLVYRVRPVGVIAAVSGVRGAMEPGSQLSPANAAEGLHRSFPLVRGRSSPRATDSGTENE
jgi:hypothetical protein